MFHQFKGHSLNRQRYVTITFLKKTKGNTIKQKCTIILLIAPKNVKMYVHAIRICLECVHAHTCLQSPGAFNFNPVLQEGKGFFWCFCFFAAIDFSPVKFHWTILVLGNLTKCTCMFYIIPCMHIDSTECHLSLSSRDKCMYDVGSMLAISQRDKRCFAAKVKKFCACAHVCPHQAAVVILCDKAL